MVVLQMFRPNKTFRVNSKTNFKIQLFFIFTYFQSDILTKVMVSMVKPRNTSWKINCSNQKLIKYHLHIYWALKLARIFIFSDDMEEFAQHLTFLSHYSAHILEII